MNGNQQPTAEQIDTYTRLEHLLHQKYLKGELDFSLVLNGLKNLAEMVRGAVNCNGWPEIPSLADRGDPIIEHFPCGMILPSRITTSDVFLEDEQCLNGDDFIVRAQKLPGSMNACALDFYAREVNWEYLPNDAVIIVFPKTIFRSLCGKRFVECLYRSGAKRFRYYHQLTDRFDRRYCVAALGLLASKTL